MKKQIFKLGFFLKFLVLLLAIGWSTSAVKAAPSYFRVEIIPVLENGAVGKLFACDNSSANGKYNNYLYNIGKDGLWTVCSDESTHWEQTIEHGKGGGVQFYMMAQPGDKRTMFIGWYWDPACTQRLGSSATGTAAFTKLTVSGNGRTLTSYPSAAAAEAGTKIVIYAKFVKTVPDFDWSTLGVTPIDEGKYYIYNIATGRFLQAPKTGNGSSSNKPGTTANPAEATLFTCDSLTTGTEAKYVNTKIDDNGVTENRSYKECLFTYKADDNVTRYASASGYSYWNWNGSAATSINYKIHVWSWTSLGTDTFLIAKGDQTGGDFTYHLEVYSDGSLDYAMQGGLKRNSGFYWTFIPENALLSQSAVTSLNENGMVTIDASPTATGTAYVKFNVSSASLPAGFNYELTGGDGHFDIVEESVTCSGGILTVPVTYTAQNVHAVSSPASTATVTVTAISGGDPVEGTVTAYVDLQPKFALMVNELDWNAEGETVYKGMEIAASQRTYLANKLIYNPAQTTGIAANNATWTATIEGTNANQFKFANGSQSVSGAYTASLLDVIYAPTTTGEHTATLHIVTSYTASNGEQTYEKNITLLGTGSAASRITFAANGSETPLTAESYNYGDIIGTNHKDVTAELFISQITNPSYIWNDPAEVFELDESTIDLTKKNQTLSFRAHPDNPVATNTDYTATLTVSGKGTANEDVSATLTLTYRALPLIQTTVTWNWMTIQENTTANNPITTNSDGIWTLEKSVGDKITYNSASKTATTAYLHHEPGITAEFVLHIPQTDTYSAFDKEYEASIAPGLTEIHIDSQEKYDTYLSYNSGAGHPTWVYYTPADSTIYSWGETVGFAISGQSKFVFTPIQHTTNSGVTFTVTERFQDGSSNTLWSQTLPWGIPREFSLSPNVVEVRVKASGRTYMKHVYYYEYDTIAANYNQVALVYDNGNISSLDISATFANKQQVTASLNATAAQYFEISAAGKSTGSSMVFDSNDGLGIGSNINKVFTVALKPGANADAARAATAGNACQLIFADDYTYNHEVLSLPILVIEPCEITYKHSANGSYTVTYQSDEVAHVVDNTDFTPSITTAEPSDYVVTLSAPTSASGYQFQGWKIDDVIVSCRETFTTSIGVDGSVIEAVFVPAEPQNFKVGDVYFADLGAALAAAGTSADSKVVTLMQESLTLGDGVNPLNYTIPAGVTLLIPHKADFFELQEIPEIVNMANKEVLSAYRTLTLTDGVTINCNGNICVSAKLLSSNGGNKSAYPTDECGVINMTHGGHIELNSGANLYCWGYIKGQDMDQGNNTVGTGTVTANAGSVVWENFELGDWRGGSASLDIYNNNVIDHRKLFPFQSYAIQNVEVPTTFMYGSVMRNYTSITTGMGDHGAVFSMIGPSETMFLLTDEQSMVRTWYDPTTDLTCYELSGTAQLDALHITVYVSMSSEDFILPICNSMHIILKDCNMTLSNPLMMQAGSIIEIKPTGTVNLENELYMYDKDQWGKYAHNYYFRSFNNLSSHKDRGAEDSKDGLDDAKLIVDGVLNVQNGGKIYTTAGGANVMGNGGGELHFKQALPGPERLWAVRVIGELPYIKWEYNDATAANLCNEDGSYTKSYGGYTFYNVHGRWFDEENNNEKADHTYDFSYYPTNDVSGDETWTSAVYSHDKTGLEARMKWFNVEADENCPNWWIGTNPAAQYNYTMLNDWHQFMATETENVYSGSDNKLYGKDECSWSEMGSVDENCLYTFIENEQEVKKALVNGEFIPLESNGYDPAYHATANASQYYICFAGCNWHPATPYTGESKAYTIHPEDEDLHYIWFDNDWMNVQRDDPFFYTEDEQTNVRTYYEYVNGDWVVATPYVSVTDEAETRNFYMIKEAFNVAQIKKGATIKLLRDLTNVSEVLSFSTQNTTCTLDLNGHVLGGTVANLVTVNAPGCTFTITDNSTLKLGKISSSQSKAVYAQKGTVVLSNGTIEATLANNVYAIECVSTGAVTINGGEVIATSTAGSKTAEAIRSNGTTIINGGTLKAVATTGTAYTVNVQNGTTTINNGYFASYATGANTRCVNVAANKTCVINGGYYNLNANLANYCASHKYPFEYNDPEYKYAVGAAWVITFKNGEETLQNTPQKPGELPVYNGVQPTKANTAEHSYVFNGWSPTLVAATADATYTAQFNEIALSSRVTLNSNGGNEALQYIYVNTGSAVGTLPEGTTKEGYTFTGWFTAASGGTQITTSTTVSADVTWYAHYSKNSYTLTWDANGGQLSGSYTSGSVAYGATITAPTATKEGCTFLGWGAPVIAKTMPAANTTYAAQWTTPYAVQHKWQNADLSGYTVHETENLDVEAGQYVTPKPKAYPGYITPAEEKTVQITEDNQVVEYLYDLIGYTITFDVNGGTCGTESADVKHGATLTLPEATRDGYELDGWFTKAVGGDQITAETVILRNIGTLYAHWTEIVVVMPDIVAENGDEITIDDDYIAAQSSNEVTNLIIENGGAVNVTANIEVENLILEGAEDNSGQLFAAPNKVTATHAYYDHTFNETTRHWRAFGVPWMVNLDATPIKEVKNQAGTPVNRTLVLGRDYDIIYYNGAKRASQGAGTHCWEWVNEGSHILQPGKCYMIAFNSNVGTLRFAKSYGAPVVFSGAMNVAANTADDPANSGINAIANPMTYHATIDAGPTTAQVHDGGLIGEDDYVLYNIEDKKFVVGKAVYVQVDAAQPVVINAADGGTGVISPAAAPKRTQAATEKRYLSLNDYYAVAIRGTNESTAAHLYVLPEEDKDDEYVIGHDLAKMGMSASRSQIWVKRYGVNLCMHTAAPVDGVTEFSVNLYAPSAGEYTIQSTPYTGESDYTLYLTRDGEAVWNLSNGAYTLTLNSGIVTNYGLRFIKSDAPQTATGIDEAVVDANGETMKVIINDQVYIIRGNNIYSIDGRLVK